MEFLLRKIVVWMFDECTDEGVEEESSFCPIHIVTLIWNNPQAEGLKVHKPSLQSLEEQHYWSPN